MINFLRRILSRRNTITMDMKSAYRRDVKRMGNGRLIMLLEDMSTMAMYCDDTPDAYLFLSRAGIVKAELKRRRAIVRECENETPLDYAETVW